MEETRAQEFASVDEATAACLALLVEDLDLGFAGLLRAQQRVVYSMALRMTGNAADAEDLTAETFLRAYRALLRYEDSKILSLRPRSWLLTIALNTWRNMVREASRRPKLVPIAGLPDPRADDADVEQAAESAESRRELGAMLDRLPPSQKMAVTLRHVLGLPLIEVAEVMKCPEGTAKSHISRGLNALRKLHAAAAQPSRPKLGLVIGTES